MIWYSRKKEDGKACIKSLMWCDMNYKEFGRDNTRTIMLLHGGGLSWWNYREEAEALKNEYHVIIPILDGHAGSDKHFTTIENNASDIIDFIQDHLGGQIFLIGGLSLGGQILLEMLSQQGDICKHAVIESAMAVPSKLTSALMRPALGCSYPLIRQKWFSMLQFRQLRIKPELFDDYCRDTCMIQKNDMIAFLKANASYSLKESFRRCTADVHIYFGEKDDQGIKKSARIIHEALSFSSITELPEMYHGDFSINHSHDYISAVRAIADES